jgi:hypothetical protein
MTGIIAGKCIVCKEDIYYMDEPYSNNVLGGVDVYMKPHYGSEFADREDMYKSVKCFICDNCFEEMMKSLGRKNVLAVRSPFQ